MLNKYNSNKVEQSSFQLLMLFIKSGFKIRVHGANRNKVHISKSKFKRKIKIRFKKESINNLITIDDDFKGNINILVDGNNNNIHIGNNVELSGTTLAIYQNNSLAVIGNDVTIGANNKIEISEFSYSPSFIIDDDCMISYNVTIRLSDAHPVYNFTHERMNIGLDFSIGKHVWIGHDTTILKSVSIGDGCIIGTSSLITKSIPNYSVAAGNPGKIIRQGDFYWSRTEDEVHIKKARSFYPIIPIKNRMPIILKFCNNQ